MNKPFSESCQQNRKPILDVIYPLLKHSQTLLEIGSGTGQHAVYFSEDMPYLQWYTSDRSEYHQGINLWLEEANNPNIHAPIRLDVSKDTWPKQKFDAVFSANTLHIMSRSNVSAFFKHVSSGMQENGLLIVYGPFNYDKQYTSASNAQFDTWLKSQNVNSGIKDFEWINDLAYAAGLTLEKDYAMPANNRILYWTKS